MSAAPPVTITDANVAVPFIQATIQHGVYKGEMPATPADQVAKANELYVLAKQAQAGGMGNQPVLQQMIAIVEGGGAPAAPAAPAEPNPFGGVPAPTAPAAPPVAPAPPVSAPPVAAPPAPPVAPPAPPAPAGPTKIVQVSTGQIFELPPGQDHEPYTNTPEYDLVAEQPAAPPAPPVAPAAPAASFAEPTPPAAGPSGVPAIDPAQYQTVEPWEGYSKENIPPIIEKLTQIVTSQDPDTVKRILAHVWEYENGASGKKRKRLQEKLQEFATGGGTSPAAPPAAAPPVAPGEGGDVMPQPPFSAPAPMGVPAPPGPVAPSAPVTTSLPDLPQYAADPTTGLIAPLDGTTQKSEAAIRAAGLPIPAEIEGEVPVLPQDFTSLAPNQLAWYASQYTSCLARANWLAAVAEGHAADAKIVADGLMRQYKAANPAARGTTVDQVEAAAYAAVPEIAQAKQVTAEWSGHAKKLRELAGIYESNLTRLSREQTRLADEAALAR